MSISNRTKAELLLLFAQSLIGLRYVCVKSLTQCCSVEYITFMRFFTGALVMYVILRKKITFNAVTIYRGVVMGLLLGVVMHLQTLGLAISSTGQAAYLSSISVVLVPLLNALIFRIVPTKWNIAATLICSAGILVMTLQSPFAFSSADILLLSSAVVSAITSLWSSRSVATKEANAYTLSFLQMLTIGIIYFFFTLFSNSWPTELPPTAIAELVYCGVIVASFCNTVSISAYRYTSVNRTSLISSTQPAFAALFGVLLLHERPTARFLCGSAMVFGATILVIIGRQRNAPTPSETTKS